MNNRAFYCTYHKYIYNSNINVKMKNLYNSNKHQMILRKQRMNDTSLILQLNDIKTRVSFQYTTIFKYYRNKTMSIYGRKYSQNVIIVISDIMITI